MKIGADGPISTHKNTKVCFVQQYPYPTRWEKNILAIIYSYGARAIFPLFYNNQDTEYETYEIEVSVAGPIFTPKNIKGSMVQQYPFPTRWEKNIVVVLHIFGARAISLLFCDHQDTESE